MSDVIVNILIVNSYEITMLYSKGNTNGANTKIAGQETSNIYRIQI